ncbi:MAG: hypothetical protein V4722_21395 [Bacteroidota bacterium]
MRNGLPLLICLGAFLVLHTSANSQSFAGKWRWQIKASEQDIQQDYLLELDLKQEGNKIYGTRTLYLKKYENMIVWVEGEVGKNGEVTINSKRLINFKLPDSIMVAKSFSYSFKKDKFNDEMMVGIFRPEEELARRPLRKLDPGFYDAIYLRPVQSIFKRLADTLSAAIDSLIETQHPSAKPVVTPGPAIVTEIEHTLTIPAGDVSIELYDNGSIDGDIVTVLVNDKVVSEHQKLGIAPISIKIKKEDLADSTMVIMQAENLGDIPPNTGLMLITVAGKRYDLNLSSTLQKRAAVVLYKQGSSKK